MSTLFKCNECPWTGKESDAYQGCCPNCLKYDSAVMIVPMSESQTPSGYRYTVFYGGGSGPDVWDAERVVYAVDIKDALAQCGDITDDGAWIISVEQSDYPQPTTKDQLAKSESELTATRSLLDEVKSALEYANQLAKQISGDGRGHARFNQLLTRLGSHE